VGKSAAFAREKLLGGRVIGLVNGARLFEGGNAVSVVGRKVTTAEA
jgi:hypothetical protein